MNASSEQETFPGSGGFPGLLEEMTIDELREFQPEVVVLPLGSTEPHGPHLPLGTDTFQVTRLCRIAVAKANQSNARALRVGIRTLMQMLIDIAVQCRDDGVKKLVIVNGHGGNPATIDAAMREIAGMDDFLNKPIKITTLADLFVKASEQNAGMQSTARHPHPLP